jgi:hypothetical protein
VTSYRDVEGAGRRIAALVGRLRLCSDLLDRLRNRDVDPAGVQHGRSFAVASNRPTSLSVIEARARRRAGSRITRLPYELRVSFAGVAEQPIMRPMADCASPSHHLLRAGYGRGSLLTAAARPARSSSSPCKAEVPISDHLRPILHQRQHVDLFLSI